MQHATKSAFSHIFPRRREADGELQSLAGGRTRALARNEGKVEEPNAFLTQITLAADADGSWRGAFCQKAPSARAARTIETSGIFQWKNGISTRRNKRYRTPLPALCINAHSHTRGNKTVEIH